MAGRGGARWWATKARQFVGHVRARVTPAERSDLAGWLPSAQLAVFDTMHAADRRHGLDVVASLRADGVTDEEVLVAGLLHDAGKGSVGVWPRVAFALGQAYGGRIWRVASLLPGWRSQIARLHDHAELSAALAAGAGCSQRTVNLIRHQDSPRDPEFGELLRLADEAN